MTHEEIREKLSRVKCFLLDMDGTFYLGDKLIEVRTKACQPACHCSRSIYAG